MSTSLFLKSKEYIQGHEYYEHFPSKTQSVNIEVDLEEPYFEVKTRTEHDERTRTREYSVYVYLVPHKEKRLLQLFDFLLQDKPKDGAESDSFDLSLKEGHYHDRRNDIKKRISHVKIFAKWNRIIIETMSGENPVIPYYNTAHYNDPKDRDNLERLQDFIVRLKSKQESRGDISLAELEDGINTQLAETKYGSEVVNHLSEGDECMRNDLLHPALSSYIHAIEWAAIAYLEDNCEIDIIEREKDGNLYNFAKGGNTVVSELKSNATIDQKTVSKIESMNGAERRWMAHHKSGEVLESEVIAVRERLLELLRQLFKQSIDA